MASSKLEKIERITDLNNERRRLLEIIEIIDKNNFRILQAKLQKVHLTT